MSRTTVLPESPGSPSSDWEVDHCGRPAWIVHLPEGNRRGWRTIIPTHAAARRRVRWSDDATLANYLQVGPAAMPRLSAVRYAGPQGRRGHPGVGRTKSEAARAVAWLRDVGRLAKVDIARAHSGSQRVVSAETKAVDRLLTAGRALLHEEATLPWCGWPGGQVEDCWEQSANFLQALQRWLAAPACAPELYPRYPRARSLAEKGAADKVALLHLLALKRVPAVLEGSVGYLASLRRLGLIETAGKTRERHGGERTLWRLSELAWDGFPCLLAEHQSRSRSAAGGR
jgi:hypothetical protein